MASGFASTEPGSSLMPGKRTLGSDDNMVFLDTAGAVAALPSLGISEELASDLKKFLTSSAGELQDSTPDQTGTHAFGASPASLQCASDAAKARTHVAKAIKDMAAGLVG